MSGGQTLDSYASEVRDFVFAVRDFICVTLGADGVGVYLHGSLAMGSFYPPKSDIDILAVTPSALGDARRVRLLMGLAALSDKRPIFGDIEFSAITKEAALAPKHPLPFEAHYSSAHKEKINTGAYAHDPAARDPDLAAHITVTRARGIALFGPPPREAFGQVPWTDYIAAILDDLDWILQPGNLSVSPYYGVLNCCRVLAALKLGPGTIMSKDEGGAWALETLSYEYHAIIEQALEAYRAHVPVHSEKERCTFGGPWSAEALLRFGDFVSGEVGRLRG